MAGYDGDVKGVLQRKSNGFWHSFYFILVKNRLLIFDVDKKGNQGNEIKEVVNLTQFNGIQEENGADSNDGNCTAAINPGKGGSLRMRVNPIQKVSPLTYLDIDCPPEYILEIQPKDGSTALALKCGSRDDFNKWRDAFLIAFDGPMSQDEASKFRKSVTLVERRLHIFINLAKSCKTDDESDMDPQQLLELLHTAQDVIEGVGSAMDNMDSFVNTLPRGLTSLSDLESLSSKLHAALSTLVLWTNRRVMLNKSTHQPADIVTQVNTILQKMMQICLQKGEMRHSRNLLQEHDLPRVRSQSVESLPYRREHKINHRGHRLSTNSVMSSQSSDSMLDSGVAGFSPFNQRNSILSSGSFTEEELPISPDLPFTSHPAPPVPPPVPVDKTPPPLATDLPPPPIPPPSSNMMRSWSRTLDKGAVPPPLPPRVLENPRLPPRHSTYSLGSNISNEFANMTTATCGSETYVISPGHQYMYSSRGSTPPEISHYRTRSSPGHSPHEYQGHSPHGPHEYQAYDDTYTNHGYDAVPPPLPCRTSSQGRYTDTEKWLEASSPHLSSSSMYSEELLSDSESESEGSVSDNDRISDDPPPLPPKTQPRLNLSCVYWSATPPPPLPPRQPPPGALKALPSEGVFPSGPPPSLPSRPATLVSAKNYTRLIGDDYQPSFSIDEDYFQQAVIQHQQDKEDYYRIGDAKRDDSIYQTFHKIELSKTVPPTPPRRPPTKPTLLPKSVAESTQSEETDVERRGMMYQADPSAELVYNYGPAQESDALHCHIRGGSVDALIAEATVYRDLEFVETVIFTHTTFIPTEELLEKLTLRFEHFKDSNPIISDNCVKLFIGVLGNVWTGLTKPMINITNDFTELLFKYKMLREAQQLEQTLAEQYSYCQAPAPSLPSSSEQPWATFLKLKPQHVALQMTQIDMEKFQQIKMCEILKYVKVPSEATSPNVCSFVNHFNSVSSWACTLILRRDTKDDRLRVYRRLLSVMEHLIKLKNFSSSLALLAALSKTAVKRVVHLNNKQEKTLASSLELMDNSESFKKLRTVLKQSKPPSIPYLGLCIADLTFLLLGNPDLLQDGNTNFTKRYGAYIFMNNIRRHQEVSYNIPAKPEIISFFNNFSDYMDDEAIWSRSEEIKPRVKRKQK